MCFQNYGLRKKWLDKCLKSPVQNTVQQPLCYRVRNTAENCTTAYLSYFSITLRKMELENVFLSDI